MSTGTGNEHYDKLIPIKTNKSKYGRVSSIYDFLGRIWTFGCIHKSKGWHINYLQAGDTVLFAGSGTGAEALMAASVGLDVVMVDLSTEMVTKAKEKFKKAGIDNATIIQGDIMNHINKEGYSIIVCNYFLDVFEYNVRQRVLHHLLSQLKEGGKLFIAGFANLKRYSMERIIVEFFHAVPIVVFHFLVGNALHKIYDYSQVLKDLGYEIAMKQHFYLFKKSFPITESFYAVRKPLN